MFPPGKPLVLFVIHLVELAICSGPEFSDIRFLGNKGYQIPAHAIYNKVYGGDGKRYGTHFPGPNEGYGIHNAHDKDPGGIDYKEFGWNYRNYMYPKQVPARHHYDGNAIYDDPGRATKSDKGKPKINLYIYNFDEDSKKENRRSKERKYKNIPDKVRSKWRKSSTKSRPVYYRPRDPYNIYEPVKRGHRRYDQTDKYRQQQRYYKEDDEETTKRGESARKGRKEKEDDGEKERDDKPGGEEKDESGYAEKDFDDDVNDDDYRAVVLRRRRLSKTYDVSAGACGYSKKTKGYCWGLQPQLYSHPNPMCYVQCDNMGNTFIRMCAKGTLWRARDYAFYNACA